MKKLMTIVILLLTVVSYAQDQKDSQRHTLSNERQNLTPEQRAEMRTNRLASQLQLNEDQKQKIHALHLENAKRMSENRQNARQRAIQNRAAARNAAKSNQDSYKEAMKSILTEEQFTSWQENMQRQERRRNHQRKQKQSRE